MKLYPVFLKKKRKEKKKQRKEKKRKEKKRKEKKRKEKKRKDILLWMKLLSAHQQTKYI